MDLALIEKLTLDLQKIREDGLYKEEREIASPQRNLISLASGKKVLNFCANNYLGLADHPEIIKAARESFDTYGFGLSSVRFICGTQTIHHRLEEKIASFLGMEASILYSSCFDANGGLFETLLGEEDAIISDSLNHASIIDGIRLCKAKRFRFQHNNMDELEEKLKEAGGCRLKMIATDGVFSMDGTIANLKAICDLADKYHAIVMVDDCHATGFLGAHGRGSHEFAGVMGRVDIMTGTLGKALGGASGGYVAAKKTVIDFLRQKSRPYLFSNTLAPSLAAGGLKAFELAEKGDDLRARLWENTRLFREEMTKRGFKIKPGTHPIVPVMLGDAKLAQIFAKKMVERAIYVIGFFYPVVPHGEARIRTQISAAHTTEDVMKALDAFAFVGKELNVIT